MARQRLTDGSGRFFDIDKAKRWKEDTYWDGHNHVSRCAGGKFDHEELYRTKSGLWILNWWSQWQGSIERWEQIDDAEAARWLSINGHEEHEACAEEYAALDLDAQVPS